MKRAMGLFFLLVIASGCASVSELPEANPYGRTLIETQPPGGRVEINGQFVGIAPLRVEMPVNYNDRAMVPIIINIYPFAMGQYVQTKTFGLADFVPTHIYFDLNLPMPPQPLLVQVNQPQRSHHRDEDDEEDSHRQRTPAVRNFARTAPVVVAQQEQVLSQNSFVHQQNTNNQISNTQNYHYQHFQNSQTPAAPTQPFPNPSKAPNTSNTGDNNTRPTSHPTTIPTSVVQPTPTISKTPVIPHEDHPIKNEVQKVSTPVSQERPQIQQVATPVLSRPEPRTRNEVRKPSVMAQPSASSVRRVSPVERPQPSSTSTFTATSTMTTTSTQTNTGTSIS